MRITGTHHIALLTSNFARLRDFYVKTLGLRIVGGFPGRNTVFIEAGNMLIELEEQNTAINRKDDREGLSWNHLAFEVDDVDAAFSELTALGVSFQGAPTDYPEEAGMMRIAFLMDPDGNIIELLQPLVGRGYTV